VTRDDRDPEHMHFVLRHEISLKSPQQPSDPPALTVAVRTLSHLGTGRRGVIKEDQVGRSTLSSLGIQYIIRLFAISTRNRPPHLSETDDDWTSTAQCPTEHLRVSAEESNVYRETEILTRLS
jgi:hypothetical protein